MKVIIFGANGKTGKYVVAQALAKGMHVTAFVRNAQAMTLTHENLQIIIGEATNATAVLQAVAGHDAIISCIGGPGMKASTTITDITRNITQAIDQTDVKRLAVIATAGIHGELKGISGIIVNFLLKNTLKDHKGAFALIQASSAAYTIARPVSLTDEAWTGNYREAETGVPNKGMRIARADVADFLVKVITDDRYIGKSIGLAD